MQISFRQKICKISFTFELSYNFILSRYYKIMETVNADKTQKQCKTKGLLKEFLKQAIEKNRTKSTVANESNSNSLKPNEHFFKKKCRNQKEY